MALSKKELRKLKEQLKKENPTAFNEISKRGTSKQKKPNIVKKENFDLQKPAKTKKIVKWNFKVNQLVTVKCNYTGKDNIGLIVKEIKIDSTTSSKNYYSVLIGNTCRLYEGNRLSFINV